MWKLKYHLTLRNNFDFLTLSILSTGFRMCFMVFSFNKSEAGPSVQDVPAPEILSASLFFL